MSRIAPDLDKLIWLVAEQGDAKAVADFEARFPQHKSELAKRIGMVGGLKRSRVALATIEMPRFQPRPAPSPVAGLYVGAGSLGLAILAAASFWLTSRTMQGNLPPSIAPEVQTSSRIPEARVVVTPPGSQAPVEVAGDAVPFASNKQAPTNWTAERQPMTVSLAETTLVKAIEGIAAQDQLTVYIAPGLEDRLVSVQLTGANGLDVLRQLGQENGFTPFDQGNGSVLIVPAIETDPATEPSGETDSVGT